MNKLNHDKMGGLGITHLNYTKLDSNEHIKASIDYFSVTFDKIKYSYKNGQYLIKKDSYNDLDVLFNMLTADKEWYEYQHDYGMHGYKHCIIIGEFIRVQFYGPKNGNGYHTTMIDMSGSACREFLGRGGNYLEFISLMIKWDAKCTRFDLAIDDHSGEICDIYDLWKNYIEPTNYTSPFHDASPVMPKNWRKETYSGFGIYFGRTGSNQLLIYDKKLERENAGKSVFDYKVWYRYEMRFKGGKATTIMKNFLINLLKSQEDFNQFAFECLYGLLDVKIRNNNDSNKNRWKTAPMWLDFLNQVKKLKIVNEYKPEQTIEKKEKWIIDNVDKTLAKLYLTRKNFLLDRLKNIGLKINDFKDKDLEEVNKDLKKNDLPILTKKDLEEIAGSLVESNEFEVYEDESEEFDENSLPF